MPKWKYSGTDDLQKVSESIHAELRKENERRLSHFGIRAYRWETASFGITLNLNKKNTYLRPNLTIDIYRFTFIIGWDNYDLNDGTTLA